MTEGRIDFGTNMPETVATVAAGVKELEALFNGVGGDLASRGALGRALQKDIQGFQALQAEVRKLEVALARLDGIQNPANRARAEAAIDRRLQNVLAQQGQASQNALRGIQAGLVAAPGLPEGQEGLLATRQLAQVGAARAKTNRELEAEAKRHTQAMAENAKFDERTLREQVASYTKAGSSFVIDPLSGRTLKLTQGGRGAREVEGAVELEQARLQRASFFATQQAKAQHELAQTDKTAALFGGLGSRGLGGDTFSGAGLAGTFGTAIKYSAAYSGLFAITGAFRDTIREAKDYRDSLTDLQVALGNTGTVSDSFVNKLSEVSRLTGGNVGEALDSAARGVRQFTRSTDSAQTKEKVGLDFATAVGHAAIITDKSITDIRGDAAAIAASFHLTADQFERINDVASGSKLFGGDPSQIMQGLASGGQALEHVGFSLEESGALIARVIGTLDESGQVAATRLSRITSIISGGAGRSLLASLPGVGVEGTARDQLLRLAQAYPDLNSGLQAKVRNTLGQANVRELTVMLDALGKGGVLLNGFTNGFDNAGKGARELGRKTTNLTGELKKLSGEIRNVQNNIFDAGAFVPFALALKTLLPALRALDDFLNIVNHLPQPLTTLAFGLGEIALVLQLVGKLQLNAAKSAITNAEALKGEASAAQLAAAAMGELTLAQRAAGGSLIGIGAGKLKTKLVGASAAEVGALEAAGASATRSGLLTGLSGKVIGGLVVAAVADTVIRSVIDNVDKQAAARTAGFDADKLVRGSTDKAGLHAASQQLKDAAQKNDAASSGITGNLLDFLLGIGNEKRARDDRAGARILDAHVKDLGDAQRHAAESGVAGVFGDVTAIDNLNNGLATLSEQGQDATTQLKLLSEALGTAFTNGQGGPGTILPGTGKVLGERVAGALLGDLDKQRADVLGPRVHTYVDKFGRNTGVPVGRDGTPLAFGTPPKDEQPDPVAEAKLRVKVAKTVDDYITAAGVANGGQLTPAQLNELAAKLSRLYVDPKMTKAQQEELQRKMYFAVTHNLLDITDPSKLIIDQTTSAQVQALLVSQGSKSAQNVALVTGDKVLAAQANIAAIRDAGATAIKNGTDVTKDTNIALIEGERALDQAISARADSYASLAKAQLGSTNNLGSLHIDMATAERHYADALKSGDVEAANQALTEGYNVAASIQKANNDLEDLAVQLADAQRKLAVRPGDSLAAAKAAVESARDTERLALERVRRGRRAPTLDFDTQGNVVGVAPDFGAQGQGIGKTSSDGVAKGWAAQDWANVGATAAKKVADAFGKIDLTPPPDTGSTPKQDAQQSDAQRAQDAYLNSLGVGAAKPGGVASKTGGTVGLGGGGAPVPPTTGGVVDPSQTEQDRINAANATAARVQKQFDERQLELRKIDAKKRSEIFAGSPLSSARADLDAANAQLTVYTKDTIEYYDALRTVHEKQLALAAAEADLLHDRRLLKIDLTDPVAVANDAAKEAKDKYDRDKKAGAREDVLNKDLLAYHSAQNTAEQTLFNKRLQDAQTAHTLGKLSDAAYLRVLRGEHDRLTAIKGRNQQQIDELNTIDLAIKSMTDALSSGQFNLGDIKVPTPFEVRRSITAGTNVNSAGNQDNRVVNITINGGDLPAINAAFRKHLGPGATSRVTVATKKGA